MDLTQVNIELQIRSCETAEADISSLHEVGKKQDRPEILWWFVLLSGQPRNTLWGRSARLGAGTVSSESNSSAVDEMANSG